MKKRIIFSSICTLLIASSIVLSSCLGSFALTNKIRDWNHHVGNKFVNELVYIGFWVLPVYPISYIADILIINSIEFWSGDSPINGVTSQIIDGKDATYIVKSDKNGYVISRADNGSIVCQFKHENSDDSWSVITPDGESVKLLRFINDNQVEMLTPSGDYIAVTLNDEGVKSYLYSTTQYLYATK